jgi:hypothetical protein
MVTSSPPRLLGHQLSASAGDPDPGGDRPLVSLSRNDEMEVISQASSDRDPVAFDNAHWDSQETTVEVISGDDGPGISAFDAWFRFRGNDEMDIILASDARDPGCRVRTG